MTQMTITDWHSHVWAPEHLGDEWATQLDANYQHSPSRGGDPESHAAAMQAAGVTECVVIAMTSAHLGMHVPNAYVAKYVESWEGRAVGVASVDPTLATAVDDLTHAAESLGMRGVKLAPPYQNFHPHSPEAFAVYRRAAELGMFMIFHQGGVSHRRGILEVAQPVLLDRVAREFPETPIIIAHMGQPWFGEVIPLLRKHPLVYADLSARCGRREQLRSLLRAAKDYNCIDKLIWGSDFPVFDPKEHAEQFLEAGDDGDVGLPTRAELNSVLYERPLDYIPGIL